MKKIYKFKIILGMALLIAGVLAEYYHLTGPDLPVFLIEIGVIVIIITGFRFHKLKDQPASDERTKKLGAYAAAYSWELTLIFIACMILANHFQIIELTVETLLSVLLLMMVFSINVFRWYFMRRGDID